MVLSEAALDNELRDYPRLRLLIVHWAAHELRLWTNKLKTGNAAKTEKQVPKP